MNDISRLGPLLAIGRTAEVYGLADDRVVKLLRPGFPEELIQAEARALERVNAAELPAPLLAGVVTFGGRTGLVSERLSGPAMAEALVRRPWQLTRLARQLAEIHAAMHARPGTGMPGRLEALARAIESVRDRVPDGSVDAALAQIRRGAAESSLLHGDLHPGNVLLTARGPVVIDWLDAAQGPPAADVARTMFLLTAGRLNEAVPRMHRMVIALLRRRFAAAYLRRYRDLRPLTDRDLDAWRLPILLARLSEDVAGEAGRLHKEIASVDRIA